MFKLHHTLKKISADHLFSSAVLPKDVLCLFEEDWLERISKIVPFKLPIPNLSFDLDSTLDGSRAENLVKYLQQIFIQANNHYPNNLYSVNRYFHHAFNITYQIHIRFNQDYDEPEFFNLLKVYGSEVVINDPVLKNMTEYFPILLDYLYERHHKEYEIFLKWLKDLGVYHLKHERISLFLEKYRKAVVYLINKA